MKPWPFHAIIAKLWFPENDVTCIPDPREYNGGPGNEATESMLLRLLWLFDLSTIICGDPYQIRMQATSYHIGKIRLAYSDALNKVHGRHTVHVLHCYCSNRDRTSW